MAMIGVDIGNTACKLAFRNQSGLTVVSQRMPENSVKDGQVLSSDSMGNFIKSMRKSHHVKGKDCSVVIESSNLFFRHMNMPPMTESELLLNLPYEFRDYISDDPEAYVYDYAVDEISYNESGEPENMRLYAVAAPKALIEQYAAILKKAGLKLKCAIPAPMAYACLLRENAKKEPEQEERDVVLVNLGHSDIIVSLMRGSHYDSVRTIDYGCQELDRIIADLKGIDEYTAGSYKTSNFENVLDDPACISFYERIAMEVSKVVNFYNFSNPEREIEHLYFLGGGASIPQLTQSISSTLSVPSDSIVELFPSEMNQDSLTPSCALAIAGLLEGEAM